VVVARLKESDAGGVDAAGQMTDAMLEDVSRIDQITTLKLGGSQSVSDAGVCHLSRLSRLRHLDLSGTGITDRGLEFLRALPELETVSLAWTKVTAAGVMHLSGCERLSSINLQGTSTGDGALRALAGKACVCQLRTGNAVTDAGLGLLHEFPIFKRWHGGEPRMGLLSYDASPNYLINFQQWDPKTNRLPAPLSDGGPDFRGDAPGLGRGQVKIFSHLHCQAQGCRRIVDRDRHRKHALSHIDRHGVEIVSRRQPPASASLVQKPMSVSVSPITRSLAESSFGSSTNGRVRAGPPVARNGPPSCSANRSAPCRLSSSTTAVYPRIAYKARRSGQEVRAHTQRRTQPGSKPL
jgi:hypothetical protein